MPAPARMTPDEFLLWALDQPARYELVDGAPMAMAGARRRHDRIVVNTLRELANQLRGQACVPFSADTAVRIPNANVRLPNAGVDCGRYDDDAMAADQPVLVIEVLSASTRDFDLFGKVEEYKTVPGLSHIVLVNPDEPQAVHWTRAGGAPWSYHLHEGLDAAIALDPPGVALRLADLYEGLAFRPKPRLVADG